MLSLLSGVSGRNRLVVLGVVLTLVGGYALYRSIAYDDTSEKSSCTNAKRQPATCSSFDKKTERRIGMAALPIGLIILTVGGVGVVARRRDRQP